MRSLDLRLRVLLAAIVPAAAMAVALAWYFTQTRLSDLDEGLRERGVAIARQLAPAAEFGVFSGNREILLQLVDAAGREADVVGASVVDIAGMTLAASGRSPFQRWTGPLPGEARMVSETRSTLVFVAPIRQLRAFSEDVFSDNLGGAPAPRTPIGAVLIVLSRESMETRKNELILSAAAITALGLILAALLARMLARGVTGPVLRLAEVVSDIKQGNLNARAGVGAPGVLKLLETGINEMADALLDARRDLERRIAEATRELQDQKERAEQANRAKTQFLAAASHDLRQPLQAAGLFVGTLRLRNRDPEIGALIDRVERALGNLEGVLEALLDISRLDAGVVEPRITRISLAAVFRSLQEMFAEPALHYGVKLRIRPTGLWCESDPLLLERILANLVSNALRYCDRGRVLVGCRISGGGIRIEVRDSGPGIPPERHRDIFGEFVQLEHRARLRDKGLGLGLAIVERLARLLGHTLELRSLPGKGSTFGVNVPRAHPAPAALQISPAEIAPPELSAKRILIIDDDADVLVALDQFLARHGAAPMVARTPGEAQALLADQTPPDLIISDYRLGGGIDGISVIHALRKSFAREVPGVILTGDTAPSVLRAVSDAGLPLMNKPVRTEILLQILTAALRAASERSGAGAPTGSPE